MFSNDFTKPSYGKSDVDFSRSDVLQSLLGSQTNDNLNAGLFNYQNMNTGLDFGSMF